MALYEWTFTDGSAATGKTVERAYDRPGSYSEVLKVTDSRGQVDYDFAVVRWWTRRGPRISLPRSTRPSRRPWAFARAIR